MTFQNKFGDVANINVRFFKAKINYTKFQGELFVK